MPLDGSTLAEEALSSAMFLSRVFSAPAHKSGSAAHFEAKVVAHRLLAQLHGQEPDSSEGTYTGEVMCFLETGYNQATQLVFDYEHPPDPPRPGLYYHMEKQLFNRAYWHVVLQGLV